MAMTSGYLLNDDHHRTIIHIDLDCFYAQVEMIKDPKLREVPMGVQQKHMVITSNYLAREKGIKKCMTVSDALRVCPELVLVNGEDLYDYRQTSSKVTSLLQKYSNLVEKLGFDENFINVSALVSERLNCANGAIKPIGHVYGEVEECDCGCVERLNIGSVIASEMREKIRNELGLTSCAGISHNKLISKIGGSVNRPNQQTVVYPSNAYELLLNLPDIKSIPGIGQVCCERLKEINVTTIKELHETPLGKLEKLFGVEKAKTLMNLSFGKDPTPVKSTGKPQTISLEDACRTISSTETEIRSKFEQLLHRLMVLVNEDGRIPRTIKVTVRKFDSVRKTSIREQKQCNISPSFFTTPVLQLSKSSEEKIISIVMRLFHKLIDIKKPYNISLLGLAFTKFQDRLSGKQSIASFLMNNISVQSVTHLQSSRDTSSPIPMDCSSPLSDFTTDGSESEIEPSPKKSKFTSLIAKRRCFASIDCPSPSKLRVSELRLNSREMDRPQIECPDGVDPEVFSELPSDVQQELLTQWKSDKEKEKKPSVSKSKPKNNTILKYLIKNK